MAEPPPEQRTIYRGAPARAWLRLQLIAANGRGHELEFLVDTGNPCGIILDTQTMQSLKWRESASVDSNFGTLNAGWLRVVIPGIPFDAKMLGYANDSVVNVVRRSDHHFAGLVGLPLLRMVEYGGDAGWFWIRPLATQ